MTGIQLSLSEIIAALSHALDMTEGQPAGHSARCCWIGMHMGQCLGLPQDELWGLYYTLLLKDAGCSSNAARLFELYGGDERAAKYDYKFVNPDRLPEILRFVVQHVGVGEPFLQRLTRLTRLIRKGDAWAREVFTARCERGADIVLRIGFSEQVANGIRYLDEHWDGNGQPYGVSGAEIPVVSRIALLAQVVDVFWMVGGKTAALDEAAARAGSWFDPALVGVLKSLAGDAALWRGLAEPDIEARILMLEPEGDLLPVDDVLLDEIVAAFGMIVDTKSPFTFHHSSRVAGYADCVASGFDLPATRCRELRHAAFLHDLGKLGISNQILDKPSSLDVTEWQVMRTHSRLSEEILSYLSCFQRVAMITGAHHERLDGQGYPNGLGADEISLETRIVTVCDMFDAMTAQRPYRRAMPVEQALSLLRREIGKSIDPVVYEMLVSQVVEGALTEREIPIGCL